MTNKEYAERLRKIHTDAAAQKEVNPLWQDFVQCRISIGEYDLRLALLKETILRCRKEEREKERIENILGKKSTRDPREITFC
ncbi:MAG: hypothetical protein IKF99_01135 [Oscillospiraceae bacterium]|nr:hypothetical protein [Oscillospiraceae bacterium]